MPNSKDINFGTIDHFLYVRINCICSDLGFSTKEFIEDAYYFIVSYIDEVGITHFEMLLQQYEKYQDYREYTRYAPRMTNQTHAFVVQGVHEEVHQHLLVIKEENGFKWLQVLQILLMTIETELDRIDAEEYKEKSLGDVVREILSDIRYEPVKGFSVDKTEKRRKYERETQKYFEGGNFKELNVGDDCADSAESDDFLD